jgi:hypothetical protein
VSGQAWLDHEWSEALLHPDAVGWDWIGMNLLDGSALTAFRLRSQERTNALWDGGSFRRPHGRSVYIFSPGEVVFSPQRRLEEPNASQATLPGGVDRAHAGGFLHGEGRHRQPGTRQPGLHRRHLLGRPERAAGLQRPSGQGTATWR